MAFFTQTKAPEQRMRLERLGIQGSFSTHYVRNILRCLEVTLIMKFQIMFFVLAMIISLLPGCARQEIPVPPAPTADTIYTIQSFSLLESVELTLPDTIVRQSVSATRDFFYKDGEIVGGIELLDIADHMNTMDLQAYADQALNVTKAVYDAEYDYMAGSDESCQAVVVRPVSAQQKKAQA